MLDFCPYEPDYGRRDGSFKKIDMNNLAYEMKFRSSKRKYEELNENTILSGVLESIVKTGPDIRLQDRYNDNSEHHILWEGQEGQENGLKRLFEAIDEGNAEADTKRIPDLTGTTMQKKLRKLNVDPKPGDKKDKGVYTISYADGDKIPIVDLVPCCPDCHRPLPGGWLDAKKFKALSLMAYTSGGKTTFLLSMMANGWECFRSLDKKLSVSEAHNYRFEKWYEDLKNASETMINKGICPTQTSPASERIPAVFFNVTYNGHKMIIGLYDNAGEAFESMDPGDPRVIMLSCMDGHLFLIEPDDMMIELPEKKTAKKLSTEQYKLMTIEEQAEYQRVNQNKSVSGNELLDGAERHIRNRKQKWFEMYSNMRNAFEMCDSLNIDVKDILKKQHMFCTVVKCDLLEKLPEFAELPQKDTIFEHGDMKLDTNRMFLQQEMIKEKIFDEYVFKTEVQEGILLENFGSVSWHCISALGCNTKEIENGQVEFDVDEYSPIRLAEPIMTCVMSMVAENGWDN